MKSEIKSELDNIMKSEIKSELDIMKTEFLIDMVIGLSNGLPGTMFLLSGILKDYSREISIDLLERLHIKKLTGQQIYEIYKYKCNKDVDKFITYNFDEWSVEI